MNVETSRKIMSLELDPIILENKQHIIKQLFNNFTAKSINRDHINYKVVSRRSSHSFQKYINSYSRLFVREIFHHRQHYSIL